MANTVISPNMNMPVPVVSTDPGPDWATNVDACLSIIDSHNHAAGQGVQITPDGIDINADLPFNDNNLISARTVRFTPQITTPAAGSDLGCLYEKGVDLFYIDGAGNNVRITQSGSVTGSTGTITGLPSGTASASFSGSTFTFQSATSTPASMALGPVTIAQAVASGKGVTLTANVAQAANYGLALPVALPSVQSSPVSDASGNMSFLALASGTFTPVLSTVQNITATSNLRDMFYTRIGNIVTCYGSVDVTAPNGTLAVFRLTLPIASTFTQSYQLQGYGAGVAVATDLEMQVYAAPSVNAAELAFYGNAGSNTMNYSFSYRVI